MKLVTMVLTFALLAVAMYYGRPYIMKAAGMKETDEVKFSSEESDLMGGVFKSALKMVSGTASRKDLAADLNGKLYGDRDPNTMAELGIEMVQPAGGSPLPVGLPGAPGAPSAPNSNVQQLGKPAPQQKLNPFLPSQSPAQQPGRPGQASAAAKQPGMPGMPELKLPGGIIDDRRAALLSHYWGLAKAHPLEFSAVPAILMGLMVVRRFRRKDKRMDGLLPLGAEMQAPAESEGFEIKHPVHSLKSEDFELLVALIYQRQGYRVTMPAGLGGGYFTLLRKAERLLVQCKKLNLDHRVPVERVRELQEAMVAAQATHAMYVASCGFTWDTRNFAKSKGITLINARVLDELITAAKERPDEDLLKVSEWLPKFSSKVKLTPPVCPSCEAPMDQLSVSNGSVWVCSQRPDCKGRRADRKLHIAAEPAAPSRSETAEGDAKVETVQPGRAVANNEPRRSEPVMPRAAQQPAAPVARTTPPAPQPEPVGRASKTAAPQAPQAAPAGRSSTVVPAQVEPVGRATRISPQQVEPVGRATKTTPPQAAPTGRVTPTPSSQPAPIGRSTGPAPAPAPSSVEPVGRGTRSVQPQVGRATPAQVAEAMKAARMSGEDSGRRRFVKSPTAPSDNATASQAEQGAKKAPVKR